MRSRWAIGRRAKIAATGVAIAEEIGAATGVEIAGVAGAADRAEEAVVEVATAAAATERFHFAQ